MLSPWERKCPTFTNLLSISPKGLLAKTILHLQMLLMFGLVYFPWHSPRG